MRNHISTASGYLAWVIKQYQILKETSQNKAAYRLLEIQLLNLKYSVTVQIVGKTFTFKATPEEILSDESLVAGFSSSDIRTITYYACEQLNKPKYKILAQRFCEKLNQIVFSVKHVNETEITEISANEISLNKHLIENLNSKEAHMIGYLSGSVQETEFQKIKRKLQEEKYS